MKYSARHMGHVNLVSGTGIRSEQTATKTPGHYRAHVAGLELCLGFDATPRDGL